MKKGMRCIGLIVLNCLLMSNLRCLPEDQQINKQQIATGVAGTLAVKEVVDTIQEHKPEFKPFLKIEEKEVCIFWDEAGTLLQCRLVLCEEEPCVREIKALDVDRQKIAVMSINGLQELLASIEIYCQQEEDLCKVIAKKYEDVDQVFLLKELEEE